MTMSRKLKNEIWVSNPETAEVLTEQKTYNIKVQSYDQFHSVFFDYLPELHKLQYTQRKVFDELAAHSNIDTGLVALIPSVKESILKRAMISDGQLRNALIALRKKKLITGSRSEYYINPAYLWRGTSDSRMNVLKNKWKMVLEFEIENTALTSEEVNKNVEAVEVENGWVTTVVSPTLEEENEWLDSWLEKNQ